MTREEVPRTRWHRPRARECSTRASSATPRRARGGIARNGFSRVDFARRALARSARARRARDSWIRAHLRDRRRRRRGRRRRRWTRASRSPTTTTPTRVREIPRERLVPRRRRRDARWMRKSPPSPRKCARFATWCADSNARRRAMTRDGIPTSLARVSRRRRRRDFRTGPRARDAARETPKTTRPPSTRDSAPDVERTSRRSRPRSMMNRRLSTP